MRYVAVPLELSLSELRANETCLSPGRYVRFIPPKVARGVHFDPLDKLVVLRDARVATRRGNLYRYAEIGDIDVTTGGVHFREMRGYLLPTDKPALAKHGDVLISTVRTYRNGIGYVMDVGDNLVTTNAVLTVRDVTNHRPGLTLLYVYSFLRSSFFEEQVWSLLNRGVYPRMDKGALNRILIPVPDDVQSIHYISCLSQAIADKEFAIRTRNARIRKLIAAELTASSASTSIAAFAHPLLSEIQLLGRMDAGVYSEAFQRKKAAVLAYPHGHDTYKSLGLTVQRGQNLQVSCIGKSIYSDQQKKGFYRLLLPTHMTDVGTVSRFGWLGNSHTLELLHEGDIVFGGEATFRCVVVCDALSCPTISNIHAIVFRHDTLQLSQKVFTGAWLRYLADWGYTDIVSVGGQGGSMAMGYLEQLPIPRFPSMKQNEVADLYHRDEPPPSGSPSLDTYVSWHREWNKKLGIWELDREMKTLQRTLSDVQEQIIDGKKVHISLSDA